MDKPQPRYNSGIQRSKGLLEVAAALYDTSLSREIHRGGSTAPQIDSRLGARLQVRIDAPAGRFVQDGVGMVLNSGGGVRQALMQVAAKEYSLAWLNPSAVVTMAHKGIGPFAEPLNLRAIAVFPSWDAVGFAVHERTGITSIEEIAAFDKPLRLSTREIVTPPFDDHATMYAVSRVLGAVGCSLDDIRARGGTIQSVQRPSHRDRSDAIAAGELDAVFDEGILSWGQFAVEHGFRILPIAGALADRVRAAGYPLASLNAARIPGLKQDVPTINFSGWPMVVHADMDDDIAYALCEAIEVRKGAMPTDNYRPLDMAQLCSGDEETPCGIPLHPGAQRFYEDRGYLRDGA